LTYLGGSVNDGAFAIAIDGAGNAYVTGFTDSTNFPVTGNALQPKFAGDGGSDPYFLFGDAFLSVVNASGSGLLYSSYFGGTYDEMGLGIAVDSSGKVYLTGNTLSSDLKTNTSSAQQTFGGATLGFPELWGDAFYAEFSSLSSASSGPVISSVGNAFGPSAIVAPNTWVAVKGTGLAPDVRQWQGSDFVNNQMPTALDGVSVLMNGTKAYVYYISSTQLNVLTPPNLALGPVQVQVIESMTSSSTVTVQSAQISPSLFVFDAPGHVVAQHVPGFSAVGPTTLYPGVTTPAHPGEEIALYANGFGSTTATVVAGSASQSGDLTGPAQVLVNNINASVLFSGLVGPGLYQFNVILPSSLPDGDLPISILYANQSTQAGTVITVQQ
jgi:uncharacterized protein (TIGR03437 family)